LNNELNRLLPFVSKPGRYTGGEINSIKKDPESVRLKFALAFPDLYEIGASNLGLQILYHILNEVSYIAAERVYAPWGDMEALLRERGLPLGTLESATPLDRFDIVGFSLQHELTYTNVLNMLDLGGIPLLASERGKEHPLIIAGGPSAFNPEPMSEFIDAFLIGDGEEAVTGICDAWLEWKGRGAGRSELLETLSGIGGLYVPSLFSCEFSADGTINRISPLKPGYERTVRRVLTDLDKAPYPTKFILPNVRPVHDRIPIEVARGCSRFCRFCQAGYTYLPVRERSPERIREIGEESLSKTGHEEVALLSLSTGDYSSLENLLAELNSRYKRRNASLSFPSLRVDTITPPIMNEMKKSRSGSFTIAPEAGSQRLRNFINKDVTESRILETVREISAAGCRSIKLYFMIGLPSETEEDLEEIVRLSRSILKEGRRAGGVKKITVSISNFIPKPHTPFQWERQDSYEETREKLSYLKKRVKDRNISLKWQDPEMSILEGVFSRGDRKTGRAILEAFKRGSRFEGWSEMMDFSLWKESFISTGIEIPDCLRRRTEGEILPWDLIDTGVSKDFLLGELDRSFHMEPTEDCRRHRCSVCGVCDHKIIKVITFYGEEIKTPDIKKIPETDIRTRLRVRYSKEGEARFLGHIDTMIAIIRMLRRSGLPLVYSKGFHPSPKMSLSPPIPLGTESLSEYFDLDLIGFNPADKFLNNVRASSPAGINITEASIIAPNEKALSEEIIEEKYMVTLPYKMIKDMDVNLSIEKFNNAEEWIISKKTKRGERSINLKDEITVLCVDASGNIEIDLSAEGGRNIRAEDALAHILGLPENLKKSLHVLKTESLFSTRRNAAALCG